MSSATIARLYSAGPRTSETGWLAAAAQAQPVADVRGPVDYKRAMVTELTVRALRSAVERGLAYA